MKKLILVIALITTITLVTTSEVSADFWDWITGNREETIEVTEEPVAVATPSGGGEAAHIPDDYPDTSDLEGPSVITNWILLKAPNGDYWMVTVDNNGNLITSPFEGEIGGEGQPEEAELPEPENEGEGEEEP